MGEGGEALPMEEMSVASDIDGAVVGRCKARVLAREGKKRSKERAL